MMSGLKEYSGRRKLCVTVVSVSELLQYPFGSWPKWLQKAWNVDFYIDTGNMANQDIPWPGMSIYVKTPIRNSYCPPNGYLVHEDDGEIKVYSPEEFFKLYELEKAFFGNQEICSVKKCEIYKSNQEEK